MIEENKPKLITFDGEARSGKGTIVQLTKDYLRDECGFKVMLIDRGQAFRALVVAASRDGVDMEDPHAIDAFLDNPTNLEYATQFVRDVYRMPKEERDALLYTNEVGENSAKIGARPASQEFVIGLTMRWVEKAGAEGYDVILVDGRALENIAREMAQDGLCDYRMGLYFICDATVGARRTLGYAMIPYDSLDDQQLSKVTSFVQQITERNERDKQRTVERLTPPQGAVVHHIPHIELSEQENTQHPPMIIIDTSSDVSKEEMSRPVAELVGRKLRE